ncbi:MAG TPA: dienelactone hydrolase family protein [Thermodesulfobacteriota bacterium]|nr:dienelactone hydrolase family protein [Thermodesulfobacteriota bacterium]
MTAFKMLKQVFVLAIILGFAVSACQKVEEKVEEAEKTEKAEKAPEVVEEEVVTEEAPKGPNIVGEEVEYSSNGTTLKGYLVYDKNIEGKRPGVLVVHEWWGLNDYARKRATMLAELGYTALAVDMYGDAKQAANPDEAGKLSGMVMSKMEDAQARFEAALNLLKGQETVDPERVAAIGYCFGGAVVLNMALRGVDLDGVASFHGILPTSSDAKPGEVKADVIVFHGGADQFLTNEQVEQFKGLMENLNVDYEVIVYPDAKHSFTVVEADSFAEKFDIPLGYNEEADKDSWERMKAFFKKIFGKEG